MIALIPVTPRRRFSFTGLFQGRGPGFRGRAAGIGDVELDGEGRERRVSWNARPVHRIGGYMVTHTPGQVVIDLLWIATREDLTGQSCQLLYDARDGRAKGDGDFRSANADAAVHPPGLHFLCTLEVSRGVTSRGGLTAPSTAGQFPDKRRLARCSDDQKTLTDPGADKT